MVWFVLYRIVWYSIMLVMCWYCIVLVLCCVVFSLCDMMVLV